jgi:hypothetical protein
MVCTRCDPPLNIPGPQTARSPLSFVRSLTRDMPLYSGFMKLQCVLHTASFEILIDIGRPQALSCQLRAITASYSPPAMLSSKEEIQMKRRPWVTGTWPPTTVKKFL